MSDEFVDVVMEFVKLVCSFNLDDFMIWVVVIVVIFEAENLFSVFSESVMVIRWVVLRWVGLFFVLSVVCTCHIEVDADSFSIVVCLVLFKLLFVVM